VFHLDDGRLVENESPVGRAVYRSVS
jgi:hypothetical protein